MKKCQKCGMPMKEKSDYAGEDESSDLCVHCGEIKKDKELEDPTDGNLA